ncbi:hypothetical protein [Sphingorhabdus lacus]|uniref:Uncharacterized protein n=1 Tax=Sphingorhabdus lacus TaxID=392610 RepID=A0A6I6L3V1_9SPHN|nr:hypothetical protein [Sphingorhabdus lacus]QGY80219.1 hypothetical protein EUU25_06055 [Sphingorhabdus lacus]
MHKKIPERVTLAQMHTGIRATDSVQAAGGWTGGACANEISADEIDGTTAASFKGRTAAKGASTAGVAVQQ